MKLAVITLALTLAGTALAHSPMPTGMRGMMTDPPVTTERECEDDSDPKCEKRTYHITFNVNEKFVKLPLSQQTSRIVAVKGWLLSEMAEKDKEHNVGFLFQAALNRQTLGWSDGDEWVWDAAYVAAINRRALR